jgi:hypothetical protein
MGIAPGTASVVPRSVWVMVRELVNVFAALGMTEV